MNNYTVIHLHTMLSNCTTNIDSITNYQDYINRAIECDMHSIAFTEHGNVFEWVKKKTACDKAGIKYIHGVECYITESLDEKKRDNYHTCLYARNLQGVYELNELVSKSHCREDSHFYYVPRITIDEFCKISDNIIISSACLGGVLASDNDEVKKKYLNYFIKNSNRCFLEFQHHKVIDQINHNKYLYDLHKQYNIPLITGTDTHALNKTHLMGRSILQKSKSIFFDNEEGWDLSFKSYDELISSYIQQNSLDMSIIEEAMENTNVLADMVEDFKLDKANKYPRLWNSPQQIFQQKINEGFKKFNISKKENKKEYIKRVREEFEVYKQTDSIDYMLFMKDVVDYAHKNDMLQGAGRGSCNGSIIAYLLEITEMDSIKYNLNFFRFMNPSRISLCDIDTDWSNKDRDKIKEFLFNYKGIYASEIITFNTIALKGAIRDVARALEIPLKIADEISKNIEVDEEKYRNKYPELFEYVDILQGVIVSVGTHPSGVLISPLPINKHIGTCTLKECNHPVSMLNMKELDSLNYVKFDILGLDNVDIINRTCKLANIERVTPDNLNLNDENVWKSIRDNTTSIFQWESASAQDYIKKLFSDETMGKIKKVTPNISYLDLFSFGNGAIRPSGSSYRDLAAQGIFKDNGLKELNDFLSNTMNYLTYQEQIMMFLVNFCGYSMAESDSVRRAIGKKLGTEDLLPEIERRFIETVNIKYNVPKEKAIEIVKPFIQVILDASSYGFSLNHSQPYSIIGYECGWLRYYYPLEFITSALNVYQDKMDKITRVTEYAKLKDIKILSPRFRHSQAEYTCDKQTNTIYKGLSSIKYLNRNVADELYELRENEYNTFIDLLNDIETKTSCNSRQLNILITINYFSEFGNNQKLLKTYELYQQLHDKKQIKKDKVKELQLNESVFEKHSNPTEKTYMQLNSNVVLNELTAKIQDLSLPISQQVQFEKEHLGYIQSTYDCDKNFIIITDIDLKYTPKLTTYRLSTGEERVFKMYKKTFNEYSLETGEIIKITGIQKKNKSKKVDDKWVKIEDEFDLWINSFCQIENYQEMRCD